MRVCLKSFLATFSISKKRVAVARSGDRPIQHIDGEDLSDDVTNEQNESLQSNVSILPHKDKRGKHGKHVNKLRDTQTDVVINHIKRFPRYTSHYSRKKILTKVTLEMYLL